MIGLALIVGAVLGWWLHGAWGEMAKREQKQSDDKTLADKHRNPPKTMGRGGQ